MEGEVIDSRSNDIGTYFWLSSYSTLRFHWDSRILRWPGKKKNEQDAVNRLKNVPVVVEVNLVNGVYDIVVKITSDALDSLKETITRDIEQYT